MTMTTMMVMTMINRIMIIEAVPYSAHPPSVCRVQQSSLKGSRRGGGKKSACCCCSTEFSLFNKHTT